MGIPEERYSRITAKNQREICLLRGFPCAWGKCAFCDYIEDNGRDREAMEALNRQVLSQVTGELGALEIINSGSCFELPSSCILRPTGSTAISWRKCGRGWAYL